MKKKFWTSKKADEEFSKWIRNRDGHRCLFCGKTYNLTCSHYWGRTHSSTRYDPDNCITLCWMPCHISVEKEKQGKYHDFMVSRLGQEKYDKLKLKANSTFPRSEAIIDCMRLLGVLE